MKPANVTIAGAHLSAESDVVVVRLSEAGYGSLEDAKLARARRLLQGVANQPGPPYMIVDLSGVYYLGAAFIGIMVSAWDELKKQNRRLVLCGLSPYSARLFHTLHLERLFTIRPSQQAALEEIGAQLCAGAGEGRTAPPVRVQVSEVAWDPDLLRLEYLGDDGKTIHCVIVRPPATLGTGPAPVIDREKRYEWGAAAGDCLSRAGSG
jgi:anti-anti-sigma factor